MFQAQAPTFRTSVARMANSPSSGIFLQGPSGIIAVPFCQRYDRLVVFFPSPCYVDHAIFLSLPILFWSQSLACVCVFAASQSQNYATFTALRTLQGLFNSPPQVIGLSIVGDMFFFHEHHSC